MSATPSSSRAQGSSIIRGSLISLGVRLLDLPSRYGFHLLVAAALGVVDTGRFYIVFSVMVALAGFGRLGMDQALTRQIAMDMASDRAAAVRPAIRRALCLVLAASAAVTALLAVGAAPFAHDVLRKNDLALPLALVEKAGLPKEQHWWVYLTALLISFFAMIPFIIYGEKRRKMKRVLLGAVVTLMLTELFFWQFGDSLRALVIGTVVFFTAFNLLEASLPSLISKVSPAGGKGTAMGVYSTSQFLGSALGGILGGWLFQHGGLSVVFLGCAALAALWLVFAVTMREPPYVTSLRLPLSPEAIREAGLTERLKAVVGVTDAVVVADEAAVYIKLDTELLDRATLERLVNNPAPTTCEA